MYGIYGFEIRATSNAIQEMKKIETEMGTMAGEAKVATGSVSTSFAEMSEKVTVAFERIKTIAESVFGALLLFKGFEFVSESGEFFEKLEQENAQLEAGLESTKYVSGETMRSLQKDQEDFAKKIDDSKDQIADMQSQLLTFPDISKKIFPQTEQAVFDMATRLHKDLDSVSIMVGKALQDPGQGATMLRRVGVNFSKEQIKFMQDLVKEGKKYQAQLYIINELQTEFGGSAEAAAKANPFFEYDKAVRDLQEDIGKTINELKKEFAPTLKAIAEGFKDTIDWMKAHKDLLISIWKVLKPVLELWLLYKAAMALAALETWATVAAQWALNAAMDANPIGIMITAIGALALAYGGLTNSIQRAEDAKNAFDNTGYQEMLDKVDALKESYTDPKTGKMDEKSYAASLQFNINRIQKQIDDANAKMKAAEQPAYNKVGFLDDPYTFLKQAISKDNAKDSKGALGLGYSISTLTSEMKALKEAQKENKLRYSPAGGNYNAVTGSAFNTSDLAGAKGGLGEAKVINIHIDTVQKNIGVKESASHASDAAQLILKEVQDLYYSQSANF